MTAYIYDNHGNAVGFIRGKYIHELGGNAVGQLNGTHVHKLNGPYVGELHKDMVVNQHLGNLGNIGHPGNPGNPGHPGNPGNRGALNYGYPDVFHELLQWVRGGYTSPHSRGGVGRPICKQSIARMAVCLR